MKNFYKTLLIILFSILLYGCGLKNIKIYSSSNEIIGNDYNEVINKLKEQGYSNIELISIDDLTTSSDPLCDTIEKIEIDGVDYSIQRKSFIKTLI